MDNGTAAVTRDPVVPANASNPDFDEMVRAERTGLISAAAAILGSRDDGEDAVQDAFAKAADRWTMVSSFDRPGAWVRRVAINTAIDRLRRRNNEDAAVDDLGRDPTRSALRPHPDPADSLGDDELWAAVRSLPEDAATALVLRYAADLDLDEVAHTLGLTPSATNALLYRSRRTLRDRLLETS